MKIAARSLRAELRKHFEHFEYFVPPHNEILEGKWKNVPSFLPGFQRSLHCGWPNACDWNIALRHHQWVRFQFLFSTNESCECEIEFCSPHFYEFDSQLLQFNCKMKNEKSFSEIILMLDLNIYQQHQYHHSFVKWQNHLIFISSDLVFTLSSSFIINFDWIFLSLIC
jgi:hypothetical protein